MPEERHRLSAGYPLDVPAPLGRAGDAGFAQPPTSAEHAPREDDSGEAGPGRRPQRFLDLLRRLRDGVLVGARVQADGSKERYCKSCGSGIGQIAPPKRKDKQSK